MAADEPTVRLNIFVSFILLLLLPFVQLVVDNSGVVSALEAKQSKEAQETVRRIGRRAVDNLPYLVYLQPHYLFIVLWLIINQSLTFKPSNKFVTKLKIHANQSLIFESSNKLFLQLRICI